MDTNNFIERSYFCKLNKKFNIYPMLKFIIISLIIIYIFARFAGFFFRIIFWIMGKSIQKKYEANAQKSNYKIHHFDNMKVIVPDKRQKNADEEGFVQYEEVK
jgi:hypothetical protein